MFEDKTNYMKLYPIKKKKKKKTTRKDGHENNRNKALQKYSIIPHYNSTLGCDTLIIFAFVNSFSEMLCA